MPSRFYLLIAAQFVSALADNALLVICISELQNTDRPGWMIPLLKALFTLAYVLLAPWAGSLADRFGKQKIMWLANGIKLLGCTGIASGFELIAGYSLVGLGAAIYSPAKYGWITEVVPRKDLVRANGWIEVSTVSAAIFGFSFGGFLISDLYSVQLLQLVDWLPNAKIFMCIFYAVAALMTLGIPSSGMNYPEHSFHPVLLIRSFGQDCLGLWCDRSASISLRVTTLFWGLGANMQLLTLVWAHQQLGLGLDQGAYLQGIAGLGVVAGAVLAARCVPTAKAYRVLPLGLLLGLSMMLMLLNHSLVTAGLLMIVVGALSGVFVVPMNAVLQARGVEILTAGRSIAVQNFYENLSILFSMAIYGVLMGANLSVSGLVVFDCIMVSGLMAWFIFSWFKRPMPS